MSIVISSALAVCDCDPRTPGNAMLVVWYTICTYPMAHRSAMPSVTQRMLDWQGVVNKPATDAPKPFHRTLQRCIWLMQY